MRQPNAKVKVAILSVTSNSVLIALKILAGILSGSVSIISEAIHSTMDLVASVIALFSVKTSSVPADEMHPYGHGKIENISGIAEGLLIFVAASLIVMEAIRKIIHPVEIGETWVAIAVMGFSALVNTMVSSLLYKVAKKEDSMALEADALHLKTDVYTSLGVGLGLLLLKLTGWAILDPIVAILVALLIVKESWHLIRSAFTPLLDASLPAEEETKIMAILDQYQAQTINYHALRTRKSGSSRFVDLHLTVASYLTVQESHALAEELEARIQSVLRGVDITIHIEPYDGE